MRPLVTRLVAVAAGLAAAGCDEPSFTIDPFPLKVTIDPTTPPLAGASALELDEDVRRVVIDTATPLTTIEAPELPLSRLDVTLSLHDAATGVARARFLFVTVITAPGTEVGSSAIGAAGTPVRGVIGADLLKRIAVRVDARAASFSFFPDIAGDSRTIERSCRAVLTAPVQGGGDFRLGEQDVILEPTRTVVSACLGASPTPRAGTIEASSLDFTTRVPRDGHDSLFVIATGLPRTLVTRAAFEATPGHSELPEAADERVHLPAGGFVDVRLGTLPSIALVHNESVTRGPCDELAASRVMERQGCRNSDAATCVCGTEQSCPAGGTIELGHINEFDTRSPPFQVGVIEETHPMIQAVRTELRPEVADIDGFLGMDVISHLVLDLDYPHDRLIAHCAAPEEGHCLIRPRIGNLEEHAQLCDDCLDPTACD